MTEIAKGHAKLAERLQSYGSQFNIGGVNGTLFKFDNGARFFLADEDAAALSTPIAAHGAVAVTERLAGLLRRATEWLPRSSPFRAEIEAALEAALRPEEAAGQGEVVKAYLAENAKHGWTGRAFGFDGGGLNVDRKGNAEFVFNMDDLEPYYEEGKSLMLAKVPASEIEALRDYFVAAFPAAFSATPSPEASDAPDIAHIQKLLRQAIGRSGEARTEAVDMLYQVFTALRAELAAVSAKKSEILQRCARLNNRAEAAEAEVARWKDAIRDENIVVGQRARSLTATKGG